MVATGSALVLDRLTWPEVCERYPEQWVVLVDVDWVDETWSEFRTAVVAAHGARPEDPLVQAEPLLPRFPDQAHLFTGKRRPHPMLA